MRLPLVGADQARDEVEGHDLLDALGALVDGEGDAAGLERQVGGALPAGDFVGLERGQLAGQRARSAAATSPAASNISSQKSPRS